MKRQRYCLYVSLTKSQNQADVIGLLSRKPFYINHSPDGIFSTITFTYKYLWEVIFWFQKLTRRGYWVSLSNR